MVKGLWIIIMLVGLIHTFVPAIAITLAAESAKDGSNNDIEALPTLTKASVTIGEDDQDSFSILSLIHI